MKNKALWENLARLHEAHDRLKRLVKELEEYNNMQLDKSIKKSMETASFTVRLTATYDEAKDESGFLVEKTNKLTGQMLVRVPYSEEQEGEANAHYLELLIDLEECTGNAYDGLCS